MESIGIKLRTTRELRGYSIEQISRDTNIAKLYLVALEEEDFNVFPGEPYVLGFLKNYSEYLNLNSDEMVNLYKNMILQEQPIPMEELIVRKTRKFPTILVLVIAIIAGLGVGGYFLYPTLLSSREERAVLREKQKTEAAENANAFILKEEVVERRFNEGQVILATVKGITYRLALAAVAEDSLVLDVSGKMKEIAAGQEQVLDLDDDSEAELKIFLREVNTKEKTVVLRLDRFIQSSIPTGVQEALAPAEPGAPAPGQTAAVSLPSLGSTNIASRRQSPTVIMEANAPQPFTVSAVFRGYCLFRYVSDGQIRDERYFHKGETFELQGVEKEIRLWLSNAGSFKARIAGVETDLGKPGEVATSLITWIKDDQSGKYKLTLVPVY